MTPEKDTPPSPLRSARFSIPIRDAATLRRPRLIDFFHENIHRKVIFIAAAAGYGKSAILVDFASEVEYPTAWCQLDSVDCDAAILADDIVSAIRHLRPNFQSIVSSLTAQRNFNTAALASALARDIASAFDDYTILVLDNFHLVQDSENAMTFIDAFVPELPEQIHLLIAGRVIPESQVFTNLATTDQIVGMDEDYLQFTPDEVQTLIKQRHNIEMPFAAAEELTANTEGWITAILLSTYSMWRGMTANIARARQTESVYGFLAEEVLDQQPQEIKTFLLESSVLPDMDVEICNEVLERTDSAQFLKLAEERHLFVNTVGDEFRAYQYHNLFRDFLIDKLRSQDPERLSTIQKRTADWYNTQGMIEAAVTFYMLAGCVEQATQIIETQAGKMYATGRYTTLAHWADQLGQHTYDTPYLNLMLALINTDRGRWDAVEERLKLAERKFTEMSDTVGCLKVQLHRGFVFYCHGNFEKGRDLINEVIRNATTLGEEDVLGAAHLHLGMCLFRLAKLAEAEQHLHRAVEILERQQKKHDLAVAMDNLSLVLHARGQNKEAEIAQQRALDLWRELKAASSLAVSLNNIGWNLHLLGQHEAAIATYNEALEWAKRGGIARAEIAILNGQSEIFTDLGDYETALSLAQEAIRRSEKGIDTTVKVYLYRGMARLERLQGHYAAALEWIERANLFQVKAHLALGSVDGLHGLILVEMGKTEEGVKILNRACDELEQSNALIDLAQALLFRAHTEFCNGRKDEALQTLTRALAASQRSGYDQMLVSEVNQTRDLFEAFADHPEIGSRLRALIARAESASTSIKRLRQAESMQTVMNKKANELHIEVRALGQSCVYKNGNEITKATWVSQKTRELFIFLVDRSPVSRETILEIFWRDKPTAQAVNNLNQTLFRLRRAIGQETVILENNECRLSPNMMVIYDAAIFESKAKAALGMGQGDLRRLEPLASAIELYGGDYLADFAVEWAGERRHALGELFINAACAYTDDLMGLTRYAETRDVLNKALKIEPLRDDLHQRMLICLHKMGRRHEVVNHYLKYCDLCRTELGLPPSPEMQTLYSRLI